MKVDTSLDVFWRDAPTSADDQQNSYELTRARINNLFQFREIPKEHKLSKFEPIFGFIYCIENLKNDKKYIGSTYGGWVNIKNPHISAPLRKRASQYVYEYNKAMKMLPEARETLRPIIRAICEDGIENFVMYPIAETNKKNHYDAEVYFINHFNTVENGYNATSTVDLQRNRKRLGRIQTVQDKIVRSKAVLAVNLETKELVHAQSMKLLGDFLNTSKDIIKNNVRSGRTYKGWHIFYINEEDRSNILFKEVLGDNLGIQSKGNSRNHSDKSKDIYIDLYNVVGNYLVDPTSDKYFSDFTKHPELVYGESNAA